MLIASEYQSEIMYVAFSTSSQFGYNIIAYIQACLGVEEWLNLYNYLTLVAQCGIALMV